MDEDFKDLEEKEYNVKKMDLITIVIASLFITFLYQFNLKGYFFEVIMPFIVIIVSYLIIFYNAKKNNSAYYLFIPIALIMMSDLVIGIDESNKYLNVLVLTLLILSFILLLLNKHYKLKENIVFGIFNLFPNGLFSNLKYLKLRKNNDDSEKRKINNILKGIGFGFCFGIVILYLLTRSDDYFRVFVEDIFATLKSFNPKHIIIFAGSFILLFSVLINILKNQDTKMREFKIQKIDKSIVTSFLVVVNSVFVLFLISEVSRLTNNFLAIPIEYTYASYAREGFFQLLFVTIINFVIILFLLYKTKLVKEDKMVRRLVVLLISFSIILIINSYYRMYLYIDHFGFTILRMQVILFLLMELILFTLIILDVLEVFKKNKALIYFVIMIGFYIINLYLCNDTIMSILNKSVLY